MTQKNIRSILHIYKAKTLDLWAETFAVGIFFVICARLYGDDAHLERCSSG